MLHSYHESRFRNAVDVTFLSFFLTNRQLMSSKAIRVTGGPGVGREYRIPQLHAFCEQLDPEAPEGDFHVRIRQWFSR